MENCTTCKFYRSEPLEPKKGTCRIRARLSVPIPTNMGITVVGFWPPVEGDAWCGEHQTNIALGH